jgi:hypothetical protein
MSFGQHRAFALASGLIDCALADGSDASDASEAAEAPGASDASEAADAPRPSDVPVGPGRAEHVVRALREAGIDPLHPQNNLDPSPGAAR